MVGLVLIAVGLMILDWIPVLVPSTWTAVLADIAAPYTELSDRFGLSAWLSRNRTYFGLAFIVLGFMARRGMVGRAVFWPFKKAYWLRRFLGKRIFGTARWAKGRDLKAAGLTTPGGLFLGRADGVDLYHSGEGHLLTIGGTGGGKSSGLVVPTLLTLTEGAIIVTDPSGELAAMTARRRAEIGPVVFLNPFAAIFGRDTGLNFPDDGFNPFSILDPAAPSFISDASALARHLLVGDRRESGSYWNDEAAEFLALTIAAIRLYEPPDLHNLAFLYRVVRDSAANIQTRLEWIMAEAHPALMDDATRFHDIIEHAKPQWTGIVSKAALATKRYAPSTPLGDHVSKTGFDAARLKTEKLTVFILVPPSMLPLALPWLNMLTGVFGAVIGRPGPNSPVTMLIDEAPALGYLPDLRAHMAQYRKAGLRVWLFSQTYAALAGPELYGADGMKELLGLTLIKQFFAVDEPEVQELVSKLAGQRSVSNPSNTGATTDTGQPLIRPDEVRGLPKWHQIIIRGGMVFPIKGKLVPYFTRTAWSSMVDANPYRT